MKLNSFLKAVCLVVSVSILFGYAVLFCYAQGEAPSVSAQSCILMDADDGLVMYQRNARSRMGMASTTKIMTALTVVKLTDTKRIVTVPKEAVGVEGSSVYLTEGERLTVEQLLYAMLLASANDAAAALAIFCSGSVEAFAEQMNAYARDMGLEDTNFINPHGLYDENHYTTAYDLALITREALKCEALKKIVSSRKATIPFEGEADKRLVVNHNKLLSSYEGAIGVKTGFTKKTGRCLVSAAQRNGLTLICVTLNAPNDWKDHTLLLDHGFENYERRLIADTGEFTYTMPTADAGSESVTLTNTAPLVLTMRKDSDLPEALVESSYRFLYVPTQKGAILGSVIVQNGDQRCVSALILKEGINKAKGRDGFWQRITEFFKKD